MWDNNRHQGMIRDDSSVILSNVIKNHIRDIQDFPRKGVLFRDITPLLQDGDTFKSTINHIAHRFQNASVDLIACVEARGFIIGAALAYALGCGFVPIRKRGKLPCRTHKETYALEYGQDCLEIHEDAIRPGQHVLIVDDLLATGGTAQAAVNMVNKLKGNIVCVVFLIELVELHGRQKLENVPVYSLIQY